MMTSNDRGWGRRWGVLLTCSLLLLWAPAGSSAATYNWNTAVPSGYFDVDANWTGVGGPFDAADIATFSGGGSHRVDFADSFFFLPVDWTNVQVQVGIGTPQGTDVTFDLGGGSYTLTATGGGVSTALRVGDGATASLTVTNGHFLTGGFVLGRNATGNGTLVIGTNTTWHNLDNVFAVGSSGTGTLHVVDGAQVTMHRMTLGAGSSSHGNLRISGPDTVVTNTGQVILASQTTSTADVRVEDGAVWYVHDLRMKTNTDIVVDNATIIRTGGGWTEAYGNTHLLNSAVLDHRGTTAIRIGDNATGVNGMIVASQSTLISTNGNAPAVYGTLLVRDTGSSVISAGGNLQVHGFDNGNSGTLLVHTGGLVSIGADLEIGRTTAGTTGIVAVAGSGAQLHATRIYVGGHSSAAVGGGFFTAADSGVVTASNSMLKVWGAGTLAVESGSVVAGRMEFVSNAVFRVTLSQGDPVPVTALATGTGANNSGNVAILEGAVFQLALAPGFSASPGQEFTILNVDGTRTGFFDVGEGDRIITPEGYEFLATYSGGSNDKSFALTLDVIPEPGALSLLGLALLALAALRRRRSGA